MSAIENLPTTTAGALAFFDECAATSTEEMLGNWRGTGMHTGHPMDGLLEATGWHGKRFDSVDDVFPLIFKDRGGFFSVNPAFLPLKLASKTSHDFRQGPIVQKARPMLRALSTSRPKARLRTVEYRGVETATMIYDALPINDHFRTIDANTRIGAMDFRGSEEPFFFLLHRE